MSNILDTISLSFILPSLLSGIGIALCTGVLGCFVIWQRMAYIGESMAHSSIIGVILGINIPIIQELGVIISGIIFILLLNLFMKNDHLEYDSVLGIIANATFATGILILSILKQPQLDIHQILLGDILFVQTHEIILIYLVATIILTLCYLRWQQLLLTIINPELAKGEGINISFNKTLISVLLILMIAISIQIIGVLLISALLIIPAATARLFGKTPATMVLIATLIGVIGIPSGLITAVHLDTPSGPTIILFLTILFTLSFILKYRKKRT